MREGLPAFLQVQGDAGEAAFVLVAPSAGALFSQNLSGILLLGAPLLGPYFVGTVPVGAPLSIAFVVPTLPAAVQGVLVHLQAALVTPSGQATLSNATTVVVLDAGF